MNLEQIHEARELYGISDWGAGYFSIGDEGRVICHPTAQEKHGVDLPRAIEQARSKGARVPMILRFPQIIDNQVDRLHSAFSEAMWEYNYGARHRAVFPFKVNQRREFIDNIVRCGRVREFGLEVGSKTELVAALGYSLGGESLLICNGFKDREFIDMGFMALTMGKNLVMVVEGLDELEMIIDQAKKMGRCPGIGIRVKLYSRGSGKWAKSSGESSKFGLTTIEVMNCLNLLDKSGFRDKLEMLHFHIGSQVTEIKRIKNAIKEASRVYCKVQKMGYDLTSLNIGGGVGVDYDGSKTSYQSSANYSLQEMANDVVYEIGEVCKDENVPVPDIITESGRVVAAYHSVLVTDIREVQGTESLEPLENVDTIFDQTTKQKVVQELIYILENINGKNFVEYYHDAIDYYEEMLTLFNLGFIKLADRAYAEQIFYRICRKSLYHSSNQKHQLEEFEHLRKRMVSKYLANFSIFQSTPDAWSIDQLFPIMPLSLHDQKPSHKATIVDITCDSDGCIERFIDRREVRGRRPPADRARSTTCRD